MNWNSTPKDKGIGAGVESAIGELIFKNAYSLPGLAADLEDFITRIACHWGASRAVGLHRFLQREESLRMQDQTGRQISDRKNDGLTVSPSAYHKDCVTARVLSCVSKAQCQRSSGIYH